MTADGTTPIEPDSVPSPAKRPRSVGSGRAGPVRVALRRALVGARESGRMTVEHEVRAVLAERYADLVDRAAKAEDPRGLLTAGDKLLELLDTLPVRVESSSGGDDDSGTPRGELIRLMDSPPSVGDSSHS